jgi:hypothetical protein
MKHPGHTYGGFVPSISERGMTMGISGGSTSCGGSSPMTPSTLATSISRTPQLVCGSTEHRVQPHDDGEQGEAGDGLWARRPCGGDHGGGPVAGNWLAGGRGMVAVDVREQHRGDVGNYSYRATTGVSALEVGRSPCIPRNLMIYILLRPCLTWLQSKIGTKVDRTTGRVFKL